MNLKQERAQELFLKAFGPQTIREPRSEAYKQGVKHALLYRFADVKIQNPYAIGTAESDAWLSGLNEGHRIFREHAKIEKKAE